MDGNEKWKWMNVVDFFFFNKAITWHNLYREI